MGKMACQNDRMGGSVDFQTRKRPTAPTLFHFFLTILRGHHLMADTWGDNLKGIGDDLTEFGDDLKPLAEEIDFDDETEFAGLTLDGDISYLSQPRERSYLDLEKVKNAGEHIKEIPPDGHALHIVISGKYQPFHLVPAFLELAAPATIDELYLCTLSFSKDNACDLIELLDTKQVKRVHLIASHYFSKANPHLYDPMAAEMKSRGQHILTCRSHVKAFLLKFSDGRKIVIHGSGNMRSAKCTEQFCIEQSEGLYDFHTTWIKGLFAKAEKIST